MIIGQFKYILRFVLVLAYGVASGQDYELKFTKIVNDKGHDPGATFAIAEDQHGFIWFGTVDGLYRYDGFNYKVFRNQKNNPNSLSWNTIRALTITSDNKLWIGTQGGGLNCLDLETEKFTHYPYIHKTPTGYAGSDIWELFTDSKGNIWIGAVGDGIYMLNRENNTFKHFNIFPPGYPTYENVTIRAIYEDSNGIIWVGMPGLGASAIDPLTGIVVNYQHNPANTKSIGSNDVYNVFEDHQKRLFLCSYSGGLSYFNRADNSFVNYTVNKSTELPDLVLAGIENSPNEFWIGTEYGLYTLNMVDFSYKSYKHQKDNANSLTDNRIRRIFKDSHGIVWIATEAGVDKIVEQKTFKIFKNKTDNSNSLPQGIVRSVFVDDNKNIWFGIIDKGLVKFDAKTQQFLRFSHNKNDKTSISGFHITSIFEDSDGDFWVGEWDTGLNLFNAKAGTFKLVVGRFNTKARLTDTRIQFIREASKNQLWIGTEGGLHLYDKKKQTCKVFKHEQGNPNSLSGNALQSNAFVQDSNGNLWIGTWSDGLNRIEFTDTLKTNIKVIHWRFDPLAQQGLNNSNVISLHLTDTFLWIGTFGGGLNRMDLKTGEFKHFTTENGLANNIIFSILDDEQGNLWLSTDRGISKFNPNTQTFTNFSKADGLQDDHFFWGSSFKSATGELFFGGINGVNSIDPQNSFNNAQMPVPFLTDLKVFEKSIEVPEPLNHTKSITLEHHQNYITFEFVGLEYINPDKCQFTVKMEGLDKEWHSTGNRKYVTYSNLAPGRYLFKLKTANKEGVWSQEPLELEINIKPPWWNNTLSRIIYVVMAISILWGFYVIRLRMLTRQTRKLGTLVNERTSQLNQQKEELHEINENLSMQKEELTQTIDELKRTQRQLIESEKMASLGILTAGVAHEINNPLNFIQGGIYGLEQYFHEHLPTHLSEVEPFVKGINEGVSRAANIVTSLNHYSRKDDNLREDCNIHEVVDNCLTMLHNTIKNRVDVIRNYSPNVTLIKGNEGKLHQVMLNILANAVQAIENKGQILITTHLDANLVEVKIQDSGKGISKENLSRIFDPFFTTKDPGKGTGLGLSVTYSIIKEHGGSISFESEEGKGTIVSIKLPVQ